MGSTTPTLPGVYPDYTAERRTVVPPSGGTVVALPIVHNWGPIGTVEECEDFAAFEALYGTDDSAGRIAVQGAFTGEGVEGFGGAGAVLVQRMAGAGAAVAAVTLNNPAATPAFDVSGLYEGTRANRLSVQVTPITNLVQELIVLDGTVEVENYSYRPGDAGALAGLAAALGRSSFIRGAVVLEGATGLAVGTFALAGGNDGATLTGLNWTNAIAAFNDWDFAFFAPYDLPWAPGAGGTAVRDTIASIVAWRAEQESVGHRFTVVIGGALDELPDDAISRAESYLDPGVITVGGPGYDDDAYGALSMSQMAARIAGVRSQRGEGMSMDMARLAGGTPRPLPTGDRVTLTNITDMVKAGVVTISRDRWTVAPTRIAADVNTYQPVVNDPLNEPADRPRAIWGNPKFVLSMQQFANDAQAELEREMIGKTIVNTASRNAAAARVLRLAKDRERRGAFAPGTIVEPVPGNDTDNFIIVKVSLTFGRALTQLFIRGTVR